LVSRDKVKAAVYAADIENCGDCWVTVCLFRQHGSFHGTNTELGWQYSATRARRSPAFA
jgi:hypothetical protein